MKKFILVSFSFFIIFCFSTLAFSQKKSTYQKTRHVSVQLDTSFSVHQYKEATSELEDLDSLSTSLSSSTDYNVLELSDKDKWGGDLGIDMNVSILTKYFRITPGLSVVFPTTSHYNTIVDLEDDDGKSLKVKQENTVGFMFPFKFGFRIKFNSFEISPYVGLAFGLYCAVIDIDSKNVIDNATKDAGLTVLQSVIAANFGTQFIFFPNSIFGFHIGLELGYNYAAKGDDLDFEWNDDYGISDKITKEGIKHIPPVSDGVYFKPYLGIAFNI